MSAVRFWSTRSSQNHWRPKQKLGEMFQIFNLIIYFSPFCGKLPNPPWRNGIFPHLEAEFVALSESLRQLEELEQREVPRGASFGGCLEICRDFFLRKYTMKPLPGDWSSQLVFSKISMGFCCWVFYGMIFGVIFIFYGKWSVWSIFCGTCLVQPSQVNLLPLRCL